MMWIRQSVTELQEEMGRATCLGSLLKEDEFAEGPGLMKTDVLGGFLAGA